MAVKSFNGSKHAEKNGQRLREALGRMGSNEGVEEEGGLAIAGEPGSVGHRRQRRKRAWFE